MTRILRCNWLPERERVELLCSLGMTRRVLQENRNFFPYNESLIEQACSVRMAGYWPGYWPWFFLFCFVFLLVAGL